MMDCLSGVRVSRTHSVITNFSPPKSARRGLVCACRELCYSLLVGVRTREIQHKWETSNNSIRSIQQGKSVSRTSPALQRLSVQRTFGAVRFSREKDRRVPATWGERLEGDRLSRADAVVESGRVQKIESRSASVDGPLTNSGLSRNGTTAPVMAGGVFPSPNPVRI